MLSALKLVYWLTQDEGNLSPDADKGNNRWKEHSYPIMELGSLWEQMLVEESISAFIGISNKIASNDTDFMFKPLIIISEWQNEISIILFSYILSVKLNILQRQLWLSG